MHKCIAGAKQSPIGGCVSLMASDQRWCYLMWRRLSPSPRQDTLLLRGSEAAWPRMAMQVSTAAWQLAAGRLMGLFVSLYIYAYI